MTTRQLAVLAMVGPLLFIVIVALLTALEWSFLRHLGSDPIRSTDVPWPSSTALGDYGWLQVLNFACLGLSIIALALCIWRELRPRPTVGVAFLFLAGLATALLAFKTDPSSSKITSWHGAIHVISFVTLLLAILIAMFVLAARIGRDRRWRGSGRYSLVAGLLVLAFVLLSMLLTPAGNLLGSLSLLTILAWLELLATRLYTVST
jgi:hypothetical protein